MARVGTYELFGKLATGGMAEVFLARSEWARGLEKMVVVKRILPHLAEDPGFVEMFFTEAELAARLSHPNVAQIIEFGESGGAYFLAMEHVDGPSLRELAAAAHRQDGGMPFAPCARIVAFCCEALAYAHELVDAEGQPLQLVHRDVSPDNILLSRAGAVKLVDFGIAKAATQSHQTRTGLVKGKLAYMAPEQLRADPVDRRADVYSLGVVLYELIAGVKPYEARSEVLMVHAMLYEDLVPLRERRPDVPPELERIVGRALERDRERRYPDCRAMHAELEEYLASARPLVSALELAKLVERYHVPRERPQVTPRRAVPALSRPVTAPPAVPVKEEPAPAVPPSPRRRQMVLLGVASLAAIPLAISVAVVWPARAVAPEAGVAEVDAGAPPKAPVQPAQRLVELVVLTEPEAMVKVRSAGRVRANHLSPVTVEVPPGLVEIEVSSADAPPFVKREELTLKAEPRRVKHMVTVGQGTARARSVLPARVFVDGVLYGHAPLDLPLYEGKHIARFECDSEFPACARVGPVTHELTIRPGEALSVVETFGKDL